MKIDYRNTFDGVVSMVHSSQPWEWLKQYQALRDIALLQELRNCTVDNLQKVQGRIAENEKLSELITAIENNICNPAE